MNITVASSKQEMGKLAAAQGAVFIRKAIELRGNANIIVATGASQFEMLEALVREDINWKVVTGFHLDEYIGLPATHPASFRKYLKERLVDKVKFKKFIYVNGEENVEEECKRLGALIEAHPIDVAFVGIGENAHLAFNDPPADFNTDKAFLEVMLDEACRRQQLGEGWFADLEDVPEKAISMSIRQIMKSEYIICTVPDERKALAVQKMLQEPVSNEVPATILQLHAQTYLFLDTHSASLLKS